MTTALYWFVAVYLTQHYAQGGECPSYINRYYEELRCIPEGKDSSGCPTSYDCSSLGSRKKDRCYYKGKEYKEHQSLEDNVSPPCLAACTCLPLGDTLSFTCANVECPDVFSGPMPVGCYRTYQHDKCCKVDEICGEEKAAPNQCEYKGKFFKEGERFYPDEEPCMTCICKAGYNGSFTEPFCKKTSCSLELVAADDLALGCSPIFYGENLCCPIGWRCPEESDQVVPANTKSSDAGKTCKFGSLSLQVGDSLNVKSSERDVACSCRVPPHVTCLQQPAPSP